MKRADAAMWVLTKIAMLFFIIALAFIVVNVGNYGRTGLCNEQARMISSRISTTMSQLFVTPLEDERRLIGLDPSIAVGEGKYSRYVVNISRLIGGMGLTSNYLIIRTSSDLDPQCSGAVSMPYPKGLDANIFFYPASDPTFATGTARSYKSTSTGPFMTNSITEWMALRPAVLNEELYGKRSTFISLIKCTSKTTAKNAYYILQDCTDPQGTGCLNLESSESIQSASGSSVSSLCGFS